MSENLKLAEDRLFHTIAKDIPPRTPISAFPFFISDFSHGICPECAKKLYPDLYKD